MKKIIISAVLICWLSTAFSQAFVRHFMTNLPSAGTTNASFYPDFRFSVGLPFVSNFYFNMNTSFSMNSVLDRIESNIAYINISKSIDKMPKVNYLATDLDFDLFSGSFKIMNNYFSIGLTTKIRSDIRLPKDLFALVWRGNYEFVGGKADLSGFGLDFMNYNELSLGYTRQILDRIHIGGRFRILQGMVDISTKKSDIWITTDTTTYKLGLHYDYNLSISGPIDTNGFSVASFQDYFVRGNRGFALDLGADWDITQKLNIGISLVDFGYINWTKNVKTYYKNDGFFAFEGLTVDTTFFLNFSDTFFSQITDSILATFKPDKGFDSYKTSLNPKIYISATYDLNKNNRFGVSLYNRFNSVYNYPSLGLLYQRKLGPLSLAGNYTVNTLGYSKIGAGLSLKIAGSRFYFMSDDVVSFFLPQNARGVSFNVGWYYVKGKKKEPKEKKNKDKN